MKKRPHSHLVKLAKSESLEVSIRIGKDGVNSSLISELENQLKKRTVVKLRINKGIASNKDDRTQIFTRIAEESNSSVIFQRGNVAVFCKASPQ
tara:strand:- start:1070 stop:1351 length:282 start_codon:yes stop_codon:yes gene_type:complete